MRRVKVILAVSGKPKTVFLAGVSSMFATLAIIWADFVPEPISLVLAAAFGYVGGLCMVQASALLQKRRQPRRN
jgi:hypothetical protein